MTFEPTPQQIALAQDLYIAEAFRALTKDTFDQWEKIMLQEGTFHFHEKHYDEHSERKRNLPEYRKIRDPKDIFLMQGIEEYGTPAYEGSDAQLYYQILRNIALEHGFIHGENALCRADNDVADAERALLEGTQNIHGVPMEKFAILKNWKEMIGILSKMFASVVTNEQLSQKLDTFFSERHKGDMGSGNLTKQL